MAITAAELQGLAFTKRRRARTWAAPRPVLFQDEVPIAVWSPLHDVQGKRSGERVLAYCQYVGCLITSTGLAMAVGISQAVAANRLTALARAGRLRRMRGQRERDPRRGRFSGPKRSVWEWVA